MGADATIAALDRLKARIDDATRDAVDDVLHKFQDAIVTEAPVGVPPNSTNAPGDLGRSVRIDGPSPVSAHSWEGMVGPTTIYARQRELGGWIYGNPLLYFYSTKQGHKIHKHEVYQVGQHYTLRAYEMVMPTVHDSVLVRIASAL